MNKTLWRNLTRKLFELLYLLETKNLQIMRILARQLKDLSLKIGNVDVVPVFTSAKREKHFRYSEVKPAVVSNQCVVYQFLNLAS